MPYSSMGHGIINFLKQTLPRTPITHALHSSPKRYTILTEQDYYTYRQQYIIALHGILLGNLILQYYWIGNTILYL